MQRLLIDADAQRWGRFDHETMQCELDEQFEQPRARSRDLVELAALQTLSHAGQVCIVEPGQLDAPAAALLRY